MASPSLSPTSTTTMEFPPSARRLRVPITGSPSPSPPVSAYPRGDDEEELGKELARLENLKLNIKQNLTLRPLGRISPGSPGANPSNIYTLNSASSNKNSPPSTAIRRTFKGLPPPLALKTGSTGSTAPTDSSGDTGSTSTGTTSPSSPSSIGEDSSPVLYTAISPNGPTLAGPQSPSEIIAHYASPESDSPSALVTSARFPGAYPVESLPQLHLATPLSTSALITLISSNDSRRPLLLDTRPTGSFLEERLKGSVNLAVPTLILKRWKKYLDKEQGGEQALAQAVGESVGGLRSFVTTEGGKDIWDRVMALDDSRPSASWSGDIVVYDQEMDEEDPLAPKSGGAPRLPLSAASPTPSWLVISILSALPAFQQVKGDRRCRVYWLEGGLSAARKDASLSELLIHGSDDMHDQYSGGGAHNGGDSDLTINGGQQEAVFTSSPTDVDLNDDRLVPEPDEDQSSPRKRSASAAPAVLTGRPGGVQGASGRGAVGGGLFSLKTDVPSSKPRPQLEIEPTQFPIATGREMAAGGAGASGSHGVGVSASDREGDVIAPPRLNHTRSMLSLKSSPTPPFKPHVNTTGPGPSAPYDYSMHYDASPSPSPSTTTANIPFPRTPTATSGMRTRSNTAMLPKLARLDTKSRERLVPPINTNLGAASSSKSIPPLPALPSDVNPPSTENPSSMPPKLSLRTTLKAATLAAPIASPKVGGFGLRLNMPASPSRQTFSPTQDFQSPLSGTSQFFTPVETPSAIQKQYPITPNASSYHHYQSFVYPPPSSSPAPNTPLTARPPPSPASAASVLTAESESAIPPFIVSTILPGFLYLGPELNTLEHVDELESLGVKRILNMAIECEPDDYNLHLDKTFERYQKIAMRDTVDEDRVAKCLKEVCEFLDDSRLHSAPTYVHCKAGKSRSVTAVMAYLIHSNHWTLSTAYEYVTKRRKGVSPNIGFVSELMNFEELKLGSKSNGVVPELSTLPTPAPVAALTRRAAHARDSLPPTFHHTQSLGEALAQIGPPVSTGGAGGNAVGAGAGEEMEVKDMDGRYRHARRAPKDETTLQPLRRVSKAGLESLSYDPAP